MTPRFGRREGCIHDLAAFLASSVPNHAEVRLSRFKSICIQGLRMGCLPAPMLRIGKYSSVPSRVIMFEQVDINKPSCCQRDHGNAKRSREKAMPSVSSQFSYLSHSNYGPTFIPGSIFLGRYYCCLFLPSTLKPKNQNRLSLWARKSSIIWSSVAAGGGRNQLSSERSL